MGRTVTYDRRIFDAADISAAKRVILTSEDEVSTEERWARETPYLASLISEQLRPREGGIYVDYGCGIGRLAKPLIERHGCRVIGVDLSTRMRALAPEYVQSQAFSVVSPQVFLALVQSGLRVDGALSVWALQHSLSPEPEVKVLAAALKPDAKACVVNLYARALPTAEGVWADDGIDVLGLLKDAMPQFMLGTLSPEAVSSKTSSRSWWGTFAR